MRLAIIFLLFCSTLVGRAQSAFFNLVDSLRYGTKLNGERIDELDLNEIVDSSIILKLRQQLRLRIEGYVPDFTIAMSKSNVEVSNFYASGQSASYWGEGLSSDLRIQQEADFAGIPILLSGSVIMQNNSINKRLSTIGIDLDYTSLLDRYRTAMNKNIVDAQIDRLSTRDLKDIDHNILVEACRQVVLSEAFQSRKRALNAYIDSLKSIGRSEVDTTSLNHLLRLQRKVNYWERNTDSVYNAGLTRLHALEQRLQTLKEAILEEQHIVEEEINVGVFRRYADKSARKSAWAAPMLAISKLKFGSFRLNSSPFEYAGVPLNGAMLEVRRNGYYGAVNYGKEASQQRQLPDYIRNLKLLGQGRNVFYAKVGIGMPERSHFHLSYSSISVHNATTDTISFALAKRNVLVGINSRYLLQQQLFVDVNASVSGADFTGTASSGELLTNLYEMSIHNAENLAAMVRFGWRDKKGRSEYTVGYQKVGARYVTLGNLFLLTNRNAFRIEGKQRILRDRGYAKFYCMYTTNDHASDITTGIRQNQLSAELSYRLDKRGSRIWASYSPGFYFENAPATSAAVFQLNLATLGAQWVRQRRKKGQWISTVQTTNYSNQSQYGDTSIVAGLWYGMWTQTYTSEKYTFNAWANVGVDKSDFRMVRDINLDIKQTITLGPVQLSQGVQLVKRYYSSGMLGGGSLGLQFDRGRRLRVGLNGAYLLALSGGESNQFYLNTILGWQLRS